MDEHERQAALADNETTAGSRSVRIVGRVWRWIAIVQFCVLVVVSGLSIWLDRRRNEAEALVELNRGRAEREIQARRTIENRLAQVQNGIDLIASIFVDLLPAPDEDEPRPLQKVLTDRLIAAAKRLESETADDHQLVAAGLQHTIAKSLLGLGAADAAVTVFSQAAQTRERLLGADAAVTLISQGNLAAAYLATGNVEQAIDRFEVTLERQRLVLGTDDPNTMNSVRGLADAYQRVGQFNESLALHQELVDRSRATLGDEHPLTQSAILQMAHDLASLQRYREAETALNELSQLYPADVPPEHADRIRMQLELAGVQVASGQIEQARLSLERLHRTLQASLGPDHLRTVRVSLELAAIYLKERRFEAGIRLLHEGHAVCERKLGVDHVVTLKWLNHLANATLASGAAEQSLPYFEQASSITQVKFGARHPASLEALGNFASACRRARRYDRSAELYQQQLELERGSLGTEHVKTVTTMGNLAAVYRDAGRLADAASMLEDASKLAEWNSSLAWVETELITTYALAGETAKGKARVQRQLDVARRELQPASLPLASALSRAGVQLLQLQLWNDAESVLRECLTLRESITPGAAVVFNVKGLIGQALLGRAKQEKAAGRDSVETYREAEKWLVEGNEGMLQRIHDIPADGLVRVRESMEYLIELYTLMGLPERVDFYRMALAAFLQSSTESYRTQQPLP